MLYPLHDEWEMQFVTNGKDALQILSNSPFDVLVTDIRMPQMSGIELLSEVVKRYPQIVRIVLSGTPDQELTLRSVALAHQYLVKPCSADVLRATIDHASNNRVMLENQTLKDLVSRLPCLPSVPTVYSALMETVRNPDSSIRDIGKVITEDLGMTTKVLQLVNSSFFGFHRRISDPVEAVVYLGTDVIRSLALTFSVFAQFEGKSGHNISVKKLRDHSVAVGSLSRRIASSLSLKRSTVDECLIGGLLHDLGKLILITNFPEEYSRASAEAAMASVPITDIEREKFHATHSEVGAYLLWLWGIPDSITAVTSLHHMPLADKAQLTHPIAIVHAADAIVNGNMSGIQTECLRLLGLADELGRWEELYAEMAAEAPTGSGIYLMEA